MCELVKVSAELLCRPQAIQEELGRNKGEVTWGRSWHTTQQMGAEEKNQPNEHARSGEPPPTTEEDREEVLLRKGDVEERKGDDPDRPGVVDLRGLVVDLLEADIGEDAANERREASPSLLGVE